MKFALSVDHGNTVEAANTIVLTPHSFLRKIGEDTFTLLSVDQINHEISSVTVRRETLNPELLKRFGF